MMIRLLQRTALLLLCLATLPAQAHTSAPEFNGVVGRYAPSDFYVTDLAFDPNGDVFLANLLRNSIDKYSPDGTLQFRIEDPAFNWIRTVAVDSNGRVYAIDNVVGNIRVYSNIDGSLLDVWPNFTCAGELHVDSLDRILIAMNGNVGCPGLGGQVKILDTTGTELSTFGSSGTGPGQFDRNYGIATDALDNIYVTEVGAQRFQKFDPYGVFQFEVGSYGSLPGEFNGPRSPAIDSNGNIYIADRRNDRIQKFDDTGAYVSEWGSRGYAPEQFFEMDSIELGPNDTIWVAGYHKNDIQVFDTNGLLIDHWTGFQSGAGDFIEARGVGVVNGELFVVDGDNNRVQVFDDATGEFVFEFGERAQGPATVFNFPRALATGPDGDLYISDDDNIRRIHPDGTFVQMYDRLPGVRPGSLGMAISNDNTMLFQSDNGNHRINKFDVATGALLGQWGIRGTGQGQFKSPRGIAVDEQGRVYVADTGNKRVQVFDVDGNFLNEWAFTSAPRAIAIDQARGIVYVGEWSKVRALDYTGATLFSWSAVGEAGGTLAGIYDIAIGANGDSIYVSEVKKAQVQRFLFPGIVRGTPSYNVGDGPEILVWQDSDDGEWHVVYNGDTNEYHDFDVTITVNAGIVDLASQNLDANGGFSVSGNTITFNGGEQSGEDGIRFFLDAPGTLTVSATLDAQPDVVPLLLGAKSYVATSSTVSLSDFTGDLRVPARVSFTEITDVAGVTYVGESWGAAWGMLNDDIYPDLFVTNHKACPDLFRNLGNGSFHEVSGTDEFPLDYCNDRWHDAHGAAWADFDNDGDQDLIQLVDNGLNNIPDPNYFFVNSAGLLTDQAEQWGLDYRYGRGRTPLWLDWNNDGKLDLLAPSSRRYDNVEWSTGLLVQQSDGTYLNIADSIGYGVTQTSSFATISDITRDGNMELVVESESRFPQAVYRAGSEPIADLKNTMGIPHMVFQRDAVIHDFTGDLHPDIYASAGDPGTELTLVDGTTIETRLTPKSNSAHSITFKTTGDLSIEIQPDWRFNKNSMYIGANSTNPTIINVPTSGETPWVSPTYFNVSSADSFTWGMPDYVSGSDKGIYIWYDADTQVWTLENSNDASANVIVTSTELVTELQAIGFDPNEQPRSPDMFFVWTENGYVESAVDAGIIEPTYARNIAVGDFDNDMDLDMFMATSGSVTNRYDLFWENQGDGTFVQLSNFGAEGTLLGRGDTATVADLDVDGNLDIFVTNGKSKEPFDRDGPSQLFRNNGTDNNWLLIDLVGIDSNRDGVGASLYLISGGKIQLREQQNGVHYRSQSHQRVHFGLAKNDIADLVIRWPSGHIQVVENIAANQLIQVHEETGEAFKAGVPSYIPGTDKNVYVWRESFDSPYKIRAVNRPDETGFEVAVLSSKDFVSVIESNLTSGDISEQSANSLAFAVLPEQSLDAGIDLVAAPNSSTVFSVSSGGHPNPRQVAMGADAIRTPPGGWLHSTSVLPLSSSLPANLEPGLTVSRDSTGSLISVRLAESGEHHTNELSLLSNSAIASVTGVGLGSGDSLSYNNASVNFAGSISYGAHGADLSVSLPSLLAIMYQRDGLFQPQRLNESSLTGSANAYHLPPMEPYDQPAYSSQNEGGVYVWKDLGGAWHIRLAAGGIFRNLQIGATSEMPFSFTTNNFEVDDTYGQWGSTVLFFNMFVQGGGYDEMIITPAEGATITLYFGGSTNVTVDDVAIGAGKWPIKTLPIKLEGWN